MQVPVCVHHTHQARRCSTKATLKNQNIIPSAGKRFPVSHHAKSEHAGKLRRRSAKQMTTTTNVTSGANPSKGHISGPKEIWLILLELAVHVYVWIRAGEPVHKMADTSAVRCAVFGNIALCAALNRHGSGGKASESACAVSACGGICTYHAHYY